jgi:glycerol-3-phosphate O-acyltransferase
MTTPTDELAPFTATGDALVLAVVTSPTERKLLDDWLTRQRKHSSADIDVFTLPSGPPSGDVLEQLIEKLKADDDRSVVPVRMFWMPTAGAEESLQAARPSRRPRPLPAHRGAAAPDPAGGLHSRSRRRRRSRFGGRPAP